MAAGIFLEPKDIMIVKGYSNYNTAWTYYRDIRNALGKKKHQKITLHEYAEYEGITLQILKEALHIK